MGIVDVISVVAAVPCGKPQVSIIEPLIMNNFAFELQLFYMLFADNTTIGG